MRSGELGCYDLSQLGQFCSVRMARWEVGLMVFRAIEELSEDLLDPAALIGEGPPASRGVAQPGRAPALGAGSRQFESGRPDHFF